MPFLTSVFVIAYIFCWIIGFSYLISSANVVQPIGNQQLKQINLDGKDNLKWQIGAYVFGFFWISELICAIFQYMLIVGVCQWYFTSTINSRGSFSIFKGLWWAFRYNLGSLAFGSFILAIIWSIRIVFEYVQKKLESIGGNNSALSCIKYIVRCCLDCCHRFVKFLNKNAYIQVALTGNNFCHSALSACALALKNSATFVITNGIGYLLSFLGKMSIAVGNTCIGYLIINQSLNLQSQQLSSLVGPLALIFIVSYLLGAVFMNVYQITSLTLL